MKFFPAILLLGVALAACSSSTEPAKEWPADPNPFIRAQGLVRLFDSTWRFDAAIFVQRQEAPQDSVASSVRAAFNVGDKPVEVASVSVENTRLEWTGA